ncbi:hypothetical protein JWH16_04355 [Xanthomonas campestris pv. campestris]|uniref:TrbI/VirB10 family protein n=1 Tax=Xanthomonas campestris TaxID=339 RepID=UPI001E321F51|nr:TrbI/VirB10 family protein [Xanthomonas campestris]MCD0253086.1 hypothetical protein [Xanthomonas campestris pv. campestris]
MTTTKSPDSLQLRKAPAVGPRLGGRAFLVGAGIFVILLAVIVYNTESRKAQNEAKPAQAASESEMRLAPAASGAEAVTRGVSDELKASTAPPAPAFDVEAALAASQVPPGMSPAAGASGSYQVPDLSGTASSVPPLASSEADRRLAEERQKQESDARKGATKISGWSSSAGGAGGGQGTGGMSGAVSPATVPGLADLEAMGKQLANMQMPGMPGQQQQPDDQAKKKEFLASTQQIESPYLAAQRQRPRSRYELKTGTIIPGIMISGIKSDLPGDVTGLVTGNVYDSATGQFLLIPAWTKVFGKYDSEVAYGQDTALVVWTRLIFPDGSTLELGGMQGADMSGYAGFKDKVNNHYGRLIGFSALSSLMGAGVQLSQPQENSANGQLTNRQIVAGEVGRDLSQLGVEVTRRNLNVQPTIEIRNGYKFTITVNRDVAFAAPYVTN